MTAGPHKTFDPYSKERELRDQSQSWNTDVVHDADSNDIPILDLTDYFTDKSEQSLHALAGQLRTACEEVGFFSIVGHQIDPRFIAAVFNGVRRFHSLGTEVKKTIIMDNPDWPVAGVGYLPFGNRKLPTRDRENLNEAFIVKKDCGIGLEHNQWLPEDHLPGFRDLIIDYADAVERLALNLLPVYAAALGLEKNFFDDAFDAPTYRLRMTHYPPSVSNPDGDFGIAPHVDTTFLTILARDNPGLTIYSERRKCWIRAPSPDNAFIVNSGELLKQWTNDRFISVKHFANNHTPGRSGYSIPFFFNANRNHVMECIPTCCGPGNPAKYPPLSYANSQAIAQGE